MSGGGLGMNHTLSGPADIVLQFGSYLIPLAVLEVYFYAQRSVRPAVKYGAASLVVAMTIVTAGGVAGAVAFMWGPYMM